MDFSKKNILYLHGRPAPHPLHGSFAKSVGASFKYVDGFFRWQDKKYPAFINFIAWFINSFSIKNIKTYDIILVDNLHFMPVFMKKLGILSSKQKIVAHMGSHTLYFIYTKKFSTLNAYLHKWLLKNYDAFLCEGKMAAELIGKISNKHPKLYTTFLGPEIKRYDILLPLQPSLQTKNIVVIATASSDFRVFYKGLDLMIKGFAIAHTNDKNLRFYILGHFNEVNKKKLLAENTEEVNNAIIFTGNVLNIEDYFIKCSLYLHCSRGDAFPTSTTEAMIAGLPTIVSEWTGTKEIVERVDSKFISQLNENCIAKKISWYFSLSLAEKNSYSIKFKEIAKNYNEKTAILHYQNTFNEFIKDSSVVS